MGSRRAGEFRGTDRFVVRRRVGAGGMGVVYEAYDLERDMRVAIKTIIDADASTLYRFKKEFRSLTDVTHPNLVKIHELVLSDDQCFYTMEFVERGGFPPLRLPDGSAVARRPAQRHAGHLRGAGVEPA